MVSAVDGNITIYLVCFIGRKYYWQEVIRIEQQNFEISIKIAKADVLALTEEQFFWLPENTQTERFLKNWILTSVKRIVANPAFAKSFVNCRPFNDGKPHTSRQHAASASQYGPDFWNTTSHEIGIQWAIDVAKNGEKAVDRLAHEKDMSSSMLVVCDYDNPNILYHAGGWRDTGAFISPAFVYRVFSHYFDFDEANYSLVPGLSYPIQD